LGFFGLLGTVRQKDLALVPPLLLCSLGLVRTTLYRTPCSPSSLPTPPPTQSREALSHSPPACSPRTPPPTRCTIVRFVRSVRSLYKEESARSTHGLLFGGGRERRGRVAFGACVPFSFARSRPTALCQCAPHPHLSQMYSAAFRKVASVHALHQQVEHSPHSTQAAMMTPSLPFPRFVFSTLFVCTFTPLKSLIQNLNANLRKGLHTFIAQVRIKL